MRQMNASIVNQDSSQPGVLHNVWPPLVPKVLLRQWVRNTNPTNVFHVNLDFTQLEAQQCAYQQNVQQVLRH
jgi:hypothetical protein